MAMSMVFALIAPLITTAITINKIIAGVVCPGDADQVKTRSGILPDQKRGRERDDG